MAATGWPLDFESVTCNSCGVEFTLSAKSNHALATALPDLPQPLQSADPRRRSEFFGELPAGRRFQVFLCMDFALGDRPGALIPVSPERSTGIRLAIQADRALPGDKPGYPRLI